jgi:hypothetical protein
MEQLEAISDFYDYYSREKWDLRKGDRGEQLLLYHAGNDPAKVGVKSAFWKP